MTFSPSWLSANTILGAFGACVHLFYPLHLDCKSIAEILYSSGKCIRNDLVYTIPQYDTQIEDTSANGFEMTAECVPILFSLTDQNATIQVRTSKKVKKVMMSCASGDEIYITDTELKTSDNMYWYFNADFYNEGQYEITITATDENENVVIKTIEVSYPI